MKKNLTSVSFNFYSNLKKNLEKIDTIRTIIQYQNGIRLKFNEVI
jgi:hypothetical protein